MTIEDLNPLGHPLTETILNNLLDLCSRINRLGIYCPYDFIPTPGRSGYRTTEEQMIVNPGAPGSAHPDGQAVDIYDSDGFIFKWCKDNIDIVKKCGLYLENPASDPDGHLHIQSRPPKSGNTIFWA